MSWGFSFCGCFKHVESNLCGNMTPRRRKSKIGEKSMKGGGEEPRMEKTFSFLHHHHELVLSSQWNTTCPIKSDPPHLCTILSTDDRLSQRYHQPFHEEDSARKSNDHNFDNDAFDDKEKRLSHMLDIHLKNHQAPTAFGLKKKKKV